LDETAEAGRQADDLALIARVAHQRDPAALREL